MLKSPQRRMNKSFSRIALVGKVEDARVADSLALLASHGERYLTTELFADDDD